MRLVLVAPPRQGKFGVRDWSWTEGGELLMLPQPCDDYSDQCGCRHSFVGLASRRATTMAVVAEFEDGAVEKLIATSTHLQELDASLGDDDDPAPGTTSALRDVELITALLEDMEAKVGAKAHVQVSVPDGDETNIRLLVEDLDDTGEAG